MPNAFHDALNSEWSLPQRQAGGAGLPTPPEEDAASSDSMLFQAHGPAWKQVERCLERARQPFDTSQQHVQEHGRDEGFHCNYSRRIDRHGEETDRNAAGKHDPDYGRDGFADELSGLKAENEELKEIMAHLSSSNTKQVNDIETERQLWASHYKELQSDNEHLQYSIFTTALSLADTTPTINPSIVDRSETRSLRQQLAYMDERCRSTTDQMARLQEQVAESRRLLARERQERLEERNNQLTVVVAKHRLERRMRDREADLQTEWRRNAELVDKCQKLEEDLADARKPVLAQCQNQALPFREPEYPTPTIEPSPDDEWNDRPSHLSPELGYSKFMRWKKRTREGHDHDQGVVGSGKKHKRKRVSPETGRLQLAGSESPPQLSLWVARHGQATMGASAVEQMVVGEFVESESPSRAVTPPVS